MTPSVPLDTDGVLNPSAAPRLSLTRDASI
jgi:hypothetical protein